MARFESIKLLSLAETHVIKLHLKEVDAVLLNGTLKETVYMSQPEGEIEPGIENYVLKLQKSLYGLEKDLRCRNKSINSHLI